MQQVRDPLLVVGAYPSDHGCIIRGTTPGEIRMKDIPFSAYDFFAYLSSGIIVVATIDVIYGSAWLLSDSQSLAVGVVGVFMAYISGQVVAQLSSPILEQLIVGKLLGRPSKLLVTDGKSRWRFLFPNYFRPLPAETRQRIKQRTSESGFNGEGEALFLHVFSTMKSRDDVKQRLHNFLNLYGFSRNICLALLISGVVAVIGPVDGRELESKGYGIALLVLSGVMFYRYLKFFRHYSYELFVSYSEAVAAKSSSQ